MLKLEALQERVPPTYPKRSYIEAELGKALAGWRGEQAIDYYLSFLQKENYVFIHDLRLKDSEGRFFQIDTLLLSQKYHIIIEVKNMAGTLYFNNDPQQLIQTTNSGEKGEKGEKAYNCPISQVERQQFQLQTFLKNLRPRVPEVPIVFLIVISNTNTVIRFAPTFKKAKQCVIQSAVIPEKVTNIHDTFKADILTQKELKKIARLLVKHHQVSNPDYLKRFDISRNDLLTGVHCPKCRQIPMQRKRGKWLCLSCQHSSKDAHIAALHDYFLLIDTTITNQQLRDFLHLPSISVASKMLTSLSLKKDGHYKGCFYSSEE
ncbi:nuclease-related domain-containing protein [Bacillaceae bacterium IKA-2]|nr:nuclease-related domain-containing protein [Bacillaceae bacterium IKA-2]